MRKAVLVVAILSGVALAAIKSYEVVPCSSYIARTDTAPGLNKVTQYFRNTVDSLWKVSVWVGDRGEGGAYDVEVWEVDGPRLAHKHNWPSPPNSWTWMEVPLDRDTTPVRGHDCRVTVTRPSGEPLEFAYNPHDPYHFGNAEVNGCTPPLPEGSDAVLRVYGLMRPATPLDWGMESMFSHLDTGPTGTGIAWRLNAALDSLGTRSIRGWFGWDWRETLPGCWDFSATDAWYRHIQEYDVSRSVIGVLAVCPRWASTYTDATGQYSVFCAPRNLWAPLDDTTAAGRNYWAKYVDTIVKRYSRIHDWEIWNEPNDTCYGQVQGITGWFRRPNIDTADGGYILQPGLRGLADLYIRLAKVADSVIHLDPARSSYRVFIGSPHQVMAETSYPGLAAGRKWLRECYESATAATGPGAFWDGVTVHAYQHSAGPTFSPGVFAAEVETVRSIMREYDDYGQLWNTEFGWSIDAANSPDSWQMAHNCAQSYVCARASEASTCGGYDRHYWFALRDLTEHFGLTDCSVETLRPAYHALRQTVAELTGKRFNGQVLSGDTAVDNHRRVCEFENPANGRRTWVAWKNSSTSDSVSLPVFTDEVETESLDYSGSMLPRDTTAAESGWLGVVLDERPVIFREPDAEAIARPDLVVDSVVLSPPTPRSTAPLVIKAYVRNHGTRSLPTSLPGGIGFYVNGTRLGTTQRDTALDQGQTMMVSYTVPAVPDSWRGPALFSSRANPDNDIVELGTDDNSGYVRAVVRVPPQSTVAPVTGGRSCVPRVILNLSSTSWEADTTGQTGVDSMQLLQALFSTNDTVPDTIIASGWFGAKTCTTWQFLAGEGRYRLGLLASDDVVNISDTAWSDFVVFDSTPPAVSVVVNSGDAFANDASVLVSWAGADSLSPPCSVRLGNAALVNVVAGSCFGTSDTLWRFTGAQADGPSGMVSLAQGSDTAAVWQSLPKAVYESLVGRYVRLSADVLVEEAGASGAVGRVEYGYVFQSDDLQSPDTLLYPSNYIEIEPGPAAFVGQDKLESRFTCPAPPSINDYKCVAAFVRCRTGEEVQGTGLVWLDNLKLERFGTDSTFSDWLPPESVQTWTLSPGDGRKTVWLAVQDVSGNETRVETCDSINLDETPPVAAVVEPSEGSKVNGEFKLLGAAYDPPVAGDTWFLCYRLEYSLDAEEWRPVDPDSVSYLPVCGPAATQPGTLGYWNTAGLEDGEYYLRLTVTDSAGNQSQDETWYQLANQDGGDSENDASGPDGGGSGLGEGSILVGSATGALRVYDEELNVLSTRTVTDSGEAAYITAAVRHSPDTLILLNARAHTLLALGSTGEPVRLARGLGLPTGIARDASGAYWLTDKLSGRLARYKRGEGLELITDSLSGPEAVGTRGDRVYVADTRNDRVAVFDTTGQELQSITGGFTGPQAIALPSTGGIYLTEPQAGRIKGITSDGTVYYTLGNTTVHKGLLASPDGTRLYTLKPAGNRVLSYRIRSADSLPGGGQAQGLKNLPKTLTLDTPRPNPSSRQTQLSYGLPRASRVSIRLYDAAGRQCANLADCQQKAGWYHLTWDGAGNGRALPAGVYFIQLTTDSGRKQKKLVRTE